MIYVISISPCRGSWCERHKGRPAEKNKAHSHDPIAQKLLIGQSSTSNAADVSVIMRQGGFAFSYTRYYRLTNARFPELGAANALLQNRNIGLTLFHALAPTNRFS